MQEKLSAIIWLLPASEKFREKAASKLDFLRCGLLERTSIWIRPIAAIAARRVQMRKWQSGSGSGSGGGGGCCLCFLALCSSLSLGFQPPTVIATRTPSTAPFRITTILLPPPHTHSSYPAESARSIPSTAPLEFEFTRTALL
jgi:hypothetical protein